MPSKRKRAQKDNGEISVKIEPLADDSDARPDPDSDSVDGNTKRMKCNSQNKDDILKEFTIIPTIGKSLAEDMYNLEIRSLEDLKMQHPDEMYTKIRAQAASPMCRCVLYAFRCAVYYASTPSQNHEEQLLKWWSWSDKNVQKFNLTKKYKHLF